MTGGKFGEDCCGPRAEFELDTTFCGRLPKGHDESACHTRNQKNKIVLQAMKRLVKDLENYPRCEQWDTSLTANNTEGPFRFGVYQPRSKPWENNGVKGIELIGGELVRTCGCLMRNGLQDDCRRLQCRGRPWCRTTPFPNCPPFTQTPKPNEDPNPYDKCTRRPWEKNPDYEWPSWMGDQHVTSPTAPTPPQDSDKKNQPGRQRQCLKT